MDCPDLAATALHRQQTLLDVSLGHCRLEPLRASGVSVMDSWLSGTGKTHESEPNDTDLRASLITSVRGELLEP